MSSTPGGDSRRRAEIDAKRAKLAELKRAREERSSRLQAGRTPSSISESHTPASSSAHRKDIDDLVATLVGSGSGSASVPRTPKTSIGTTLEDGATYSIASPRRGGVSQADVGTSSDFDGSESLPPSSNAIARNETSDTQVSQMGPEGRGAAEMVDVATELFEFPQKERVYYTKEIQTVAEPEGRGGSADTPYTTAVGVGADSHTDISPSTEAAIRKRILEEHTEALEKDRQMKREEEELERQIQEELRIMSPEEVAAVFGMQDFSDFVESSSRIVERALTDAYDYMKDYTIVASGVSDESARDEVKLSRCFYDERLCRGRSITAIDWSQKHPELLAVAYSRSDIIADSSPDGLVLVWNIHLLDRPEFIFQAQTDILSVCFSPFHPHLVIGGSYSGQILMWDTRSRSRSSVVGGSSSMGPGFHGGVLPTLKTPLSASAGHTHPVYSLTIVGTQNANHLITASTDGLVCSWMLPDLLARPVESLQLLNTSHPKTDEVSITSMAFMQQGKVETNAFWIGTEEGGIWMAARFDRAGAKAGLQGSAAGGSHAAPVTALDFHRASSGAGIGQYSGSSAGTDFSELFLSCSMDWTAKLWRVSPVSATSATSAAAGHPSARNKPLAGATSGAATGASAHALVPLLTFDDYSDYVTSVQWHPAHPSIFASCDAAGLVHIHDLARDAERPVSQVRVGGESSNGANAIVTPANGAAGASASGHQSVGLNKVAWEKTAESRRLACGGTDGRVYVLDAGRLTTTSGSGEEWVEMGRLIGRTAASAVAATATSAAAPASSQPVRV